ncbi:MAG: CHRD domain-containing protein [Saprospiraceae bacterium]
MKRRFTSYFIGTFALLFLLNFQVKAENGQMLFVAELSTIKQVPGILGDALGLVTFLLSEDGKEINIHGSFTKLSGNVTGCHIHLGDENSNGPVIIDLSSFITGNRIKGRIATPPNFVANAVIGDLYVNVHTALNPGGEIRSQLNLRSEILFPFVLNGANQIPANASKGIGLGVLRFSSNLTRFNYQIFYTGLSGPPTGAHIHKGNDSTNGPVLIPLTTTNIITGDITDQIATLETFFTFLDVGIYVNIHTAAFPNGEIRGQIVSPQPIASSSILNGSQETPPVVTNAKAYGYAYLNYPLFDSLNYVVFSEGIVATAAHIHRAAAGVAGPVVMGLTALFPGIYGGTIPMSDLNKTAFMKDELYFNIHSAANPGGEIRGQFENNNMKSFAFDLCGDQESPKKSVNGYGAAYVSVNKANTELDYSLIVNDLTGDATAAHIHGAAFGVSGSVLLPILTPAPYSSGVVDVTGLVAGKIDSDGAYMNVHTAANAGGEIRGQIRRTLSCEINTGNVDLTGSDIQFSQSQSKDAIVLKIDLLRNTNLDFGLVNIDGKSVYNVTRNLGGGTNQIEFSSQEFVGGFYLLLVKENGKTIKTFKWVKI